MKTIILFVVCTYFQLIFVSAEMQQNRVIPANMIEIVETMNSTKNFLQSMVRRNPSFSQGRPSLLGPQNEVIENALFSDNMDRPSTAGVEIVQSMVSEQATACSPKAVAVTLPSDPDLSVIYYPTCISAMRCGGCCMQEQHECGPIREERKIHKILKARYPYLGAPNFLFDGLIDVEVEDHLECSCQCKNKPHHCDLTKHVYERATCSCRCLADGQKNNCKSPQLWDNQQCACVCPALKYCQAHEYFSFATCTCESSREIVSTSLESGSLVDAACVSTRCRSGFIAVKSQGVCQCQMATQWGDSAQANIRVTGVPRTTPSIPEASTRRTRPGRRPRPSRG